MPGDKYSPPVFPGGDAMSKGESIHATHSTFEPARESNRYINHAKNLCESMDFEEMESVMWRKVSCVYCFFVFSNT